MIERGLAQQWRYLQRDPLVRHQLFPFNFRRRRKYYNNFGQRAKPLRSHLMLAQSEDFIDRNTEYTNKFYFNHQRVPYYSGRYSPRNRQIIPERKRRRFQQQHSISRLASRPRHYEYQDNRHPSSNNYWEDDYQLRDYFYYG